MDEQLSVIASDRPLPARRRRVLRESWLDALSRSKLQATRHALELGGFGSESYTESLAQANVQFGVSYHLRLAALGTRPLRRHWQKSVDCAPEVRAKLDAWRSREAGAVLIVPHLGDFDIAGTWLAETVGAHVTVVVDRLSLRADQWLYNAGRRRAKLRLRDARETQLSDLRRDLEDGRFVVLMLDRQPRGESVDVPFFGQSAHISVAPVALCAQTQAELAVAATVSHQRRRQIHLRTIPTTLSVCGQARAATDICAEIASQMEALIRIAPTQWLISSDISQLIWHSRAHT